MIWLTSLATLCLGIDLGWRWGSRAPVEPESWGPADPLRHLGPAPVPLDVVDATDLHLAQTPADIRWSR